MTEVRVRVRGLDELRRTLKKVSADLPGEIADANQGAAEIVASEARRRAPAGPHEGGGTVTPIKTSIRAQRRARAGVVGMGGASTPHAEVTEFGGSIPRRGAVKEIVARARRQHVGFEFAGITSRTHIRQRAFLYPAIDATREEVIDYYGDAVERILSR